MRPAKVLSNVVLPAKVRPKMVYICPFDISKQTLSKCHSLPGLKLRFDAISDITLALQIGYPLTSIVQQ